MELAVTVTCVLLSILQCVRTDLSALWITDCDSVNRTKACFRDPPECIGFSTEDFLYDDTVCNFVVTWQQTYDQKYINFEVYAPVQNDLEYVAIAFSPDKKMGGSDVLACLSYEGSIQVAHSYNTVSHFNEPRDLVGVSRVSGSISNGILNCNFTRTKHIEGQSSFHDLRKDFYMLASRGLALNGQITYHKFGKYISEEKYDFGKFTAEPDPTTQSLTSDVTYRKPGGQIGGSCSSNPCQNSGKCSSTNNGFICVCENNFIGDRCERDSSGSAPVQAAFTVTISTLMMVYVLTL